MWNPFAKTYSFDLTFEKKKMGRLESLPAATPMEDLRVKLCSAAFCRAAGEFCVLSFFRFSLFFFSFGFAF